MPRPRDGQSNAYLLDTDKQKQVTHGVGLPD